LMPMPRHRRKRGYPLAILVGLDGIQAALWSVFSESVKPGKRVQEEDEYKFYESIVDALRPSMKQGINSILIAAPDEKDYQGFLNHIRRHQSWLMNGIDTNTITLERLPEPAMEPHQVRKLVRKRGFKEKLTEVYRGDIQQVMNVLERHLNNPDDIETLLFTLGEVENAVYMDCRSPDYILVTEDFRLKHRRRINRLLQVAANKDVKTRIIKSDTPEATRITQLGGLVCMLKG
jgi:stalled ribosome rescue protein Dom34